MSMDNLSNEDIKDYILLSLEMAQECATALDDMVSDNVERLETQERMQGWVEDANSFVAEANRRGMDTRWLLP